MTHAINPLLDFSNLPLFDAIQPAHIAPALDELLPAADAALAQVTAADFPAEWKAIASVLDVATERLGRAWGAISHLHSVADTPELREACPKLSHTGQSLAVGRTQFRGVCHAV